MDTSNLTCEHLYQDLKMWSGLHVTTFQYQCVPSCDLGHTEANLLNIPPLWNEKKSQQAVFKLCEMLSIINYVGPPCNSSISFISNVFFLCLKKKKPLNQFVPFIRDQESSFVPGVN